MNSPLFLKKMALEGDGDVKDLVLDSLEGLLECDSKDIIAMRFGSKTKQLWASVSQQV